MQQRLVKCFSALLYCATAVGAIWLAVRFLLPWAAPFLLAFALASVMEPFVRYLARHKWKRSIAAGLATLSLLALIVCVLVYIVSRGITAITDFASRAPALIDTFGQTLALLEHRILAYIDAAPDGLSSYFKTALDTMGNSLHRLPAIISQWALDTVARIAQSSPDVLLFTVTAGIGTYFFSASFPNILAFIAAQLPEGFINRLDGLGYDLKNSFGGFFRAQLILMAITFFELVIVMLLLKVDNAVGIAAVTALIDALPVFGTGIVLVPWGIYSIMLGNLARGITLLIAWGLVNLVRSCIQAKLLGDQIGLDPLASLISIYIGWRVWHVWGMLLFPILFVTIQQLNDKGVIRLWKNA